MKRIVSADEMRWCDETTIKSYDVPGMLLMEVAGRGAVEAIRKEFPDISRRHVLVVCGKGNNGGDGLVVARWLSDDAAHVSVILLPAPSELKGDAKANYEILRTYAKKSQGRLNIYRYSKNVLNALGAPHLIVDAIFGTGFSGPVRKPIDGVIAWMNRQKAPIVSLDIPSGANGTTGRIGNCAVHAKMTVTFGALKSGLVCGRGRELSGSVRIVDIGIPQSVLSDKKLQTSLVVSSDVRCVLPKRSIHAHKYSVGKVLVIAGSKGLTGAAALAATAAMRSGAGAVVLGTPESVYPILAKKLTESMVFPVAATSEGTIGLAAMDAIRARLSWADVLVLGPGLSQNPETQDVIVKIISEFGGKILLDADGLNAIAASGVSSIRSSRAQIILTPHVGECARLAGIPSEEVELNRIEVARSLAHKLKATVVLKGVPTVTALGSGEAYLNSTGNPGMATAGSGDVLSGVIGGMWAQGMTAGEAAWTGVHLHGLAGDVAAKALGEKSLLASDIIDKLPYALQQIEAGDSP